MVPNGWEVKKLEELATKISDGIHSTPKYTDNSQIYFINGNNLKNGSIVITEKTKEVCPVNATQHRRDLSNRTILMSINGTIGNLAFYNNENVVLGKSACYINVAKGVDVNYIYYMLNDSRTQAFYTSELTGSTIKNLSLKTIKSTKVLTPPLPEQQKIAQILTTWDKAIDTTERLIDNSKQQKKALMRQLLTGKKRLLDDKDQRFEGEWEEFKLGDLGSTFNGLTGKTKVDFGSGEKYIPYINIFRNTFIDTDNLDFVNIGADEKQNTVQLGDIFFTTSSETPEEVGMSSVFISDTKENIYLNSFCFGFRLHSLERVSPFFIGYMLRSSEIRRKISVLAQGSTRFNLSKRQLVKITIPLPPIEEQQKIAAVLTNADKEIELLEQQLADLQQEKKALMQVLLTGKKRVVVDGGTA